MSPKLPKIPFLLRMIGLILQYDDDGKDSDDYDETSICNLSRIHQKLIIMIQDYLKCF